MKPAFSPPARHRALRLQAAALAFALCACGAAHAKLPTSIEILGFDNPYSSDCVDVMVKLRLQGLTPNTGNPLYFFFTVTQDGVTKRFDGSGGTPFPVDADTTGKSDPDPEQSFAVHYPDPNALASWLTNKPFEFSVDAMLSATATSGVRSDTVSVSGCAKPITFTVTKPGGPFGGSSGSATAVPTLSGAGLAFTALALPAFAVPALRRRRKHGAQNTDTKQ